MVDAALLLLVVTVLLSGVDGTVDPAKRCRMISNICRAHHHTQRKSLKRGLRSFSLRSLLLFIAFIEQTHCALVACDSK